MMQEEKADNQMNSNSGFWRQLWNLKIPLNVKHFLWRAASGCLPTRDVLRTKKVDVSVWCPVCNEQPETTLHILVQCPFANSCLNSENRSVNTGIFSSFADWLQSLLEQQNRRLALIMVMICWTLWKSRNDLIWNQRSLEMSEVVESAKANLIQWQSVQDRTFDRFMGFMTHEDGQERWNLPMCDRIKINVDAAIFDSSSCYSYAIVIRDHNGALLEAVSSCKQATVTPELAEAVGIKEALSWVKNQGKENVDIESDCLQVIQAIRCSFSSRSYLGKIVEECKQLMEELKDHSVVLRFVKRSANRVSHYLARYSCLVADRRWTEGNAHPEFISVLLNDLRS
ncbi:hypothetical protein OROHE_023753 [Orobanche hederae]